MDLDALEALEHVYGGECIAKIRKALPALLAEVKAAREWLRCTDAIHQEQEDLDSESEIDFSALEQKAFDAYRALVEEHS